MVSLYYYKQQSQEFYTQKAEGQHSTVILRTGEEAERWGFQGQARPHSQTLLHIKTKQNKQQNSQHKGTERMLNLKLWGSVLSKIPISSLSLHPLQVRFEASSWSGHTHLLVPAVVGEKARLQFDCLSHQISGCQIRDPWGLKRAKDTRDPPLSLHALPPPFLGITPFPFQEFPALHPGIWDSLAAVSSNKTFPFLKPLTRHIAKYTTRIVEAELSSEQSCDHAAVYLSVCLSMALTTLLTNILSITVSYLTPRPKTFCCFFLYIFSTLT